MTISPVPVLKNALDDVAGVCAAAFGAVNARLNLSGGGLVSATARATTGGANKEDDERGDAADGGSVAASAAVGTMANIAPMRPQLTMRRTTEEP